MNRINLHSFFFEKEIGERVPTTKGSHFSASMEKLPVEVEEEI